MKLIFLVLFLGATLSMQGQTPAVNSATSVAVPNGGCGTTSLTAYAVLAGGTTTTANCQQVSGLGSSGQVLTSNGAAALPTWQAAAGGGVTSLAATSPFAVSGATGAVTGSLLTNVDFAFTAAQSVSLATTTTQAAGLSAISTTPATVGAQKYSPLLLLRGNGWKTNATAGSEVADAGLQVRPFQSATDPYVSLALSTSVNAGAHTVHMLLGGLPGFVTSYGGLWPGGVTPATTNYALLIANDGSETDLNGSNVNFSVGNAVKLHVDSSRIQASINLDVGPSLGSPVATWNATSGLITRFGNINTVSNGVPSELATIDLTAQTAAKGSTTLYTPTATGYFRFTYVAKITTAASISSILGGTAGLILSYQDGTDSVAVTMTCPETDQAGTSLAVGTGNTLNTTAAMITGSCIIYAKTGVAINYTFGYSSTNAAEMVYALRGKLEAM